MLLTALMAWQFQSIVSVEDVDERGSITQGIRFVVIL